MRALRIQNLPLDDNDDVKGQSSQTHQEFSDIEMGITKKEWVAERHRVQLNLNKA